MTEIISEVRASVISEQVERGQAVVYLGENTARAVGAATAAEVAAAAALLAAEGLEAYGDILADVAGTRAVQVGYDGDLAHTGFGGGFGAAGQDKTFLIGQAIADGTLAALGLGVYSLGSGALHLLILEGDTPASLTVVDSIALTALATGHNEFDSGDFGAIDLTAGQWVGYSIPTGGIDLYSDPAGDTYYANAAYTAGTHAVSLLLGQEMLARFTQGVPALSIATVADDDWPSRAFGYMLPAAAPTQFDVFLIAGQSNAQGEGGGYDPLSLPVGVAKQWYAAALTDLTADPVGNANGNSAWIAFAQRYWALTGRGVIFVPTAVGGSGLVVDIGFGNWSPSGALRAAAVTAVNAAKAAATSAGLRHKFAGVLWWQGEAEGITYDASGTMIGGGAVTAAAYVAGFQALQSYFQTQFASSVMPMVIARIGIKSTGSTTGFTTIQGALETLAKGSRDIAMAYIAPQASVTTYHYPPEIYAAAGQDFATVAAAVCVGRA